MNDNAKWRAVRLDDLERRGRFIPVREHLGIHSFGINAIKQGEDGTLINEHDEAGGQEEVYVVLDGTATFEIDGETVEAPAGTFISSSRKRGARRRGTQPSSPSAALSARRTRRWTGARRGRSRTSRWTPTARNATATRPPRSPRPRAVPGPPGPQLQLRVLRDARGRHRRRDVRSPPTIRRAVSALR